MEWGSIQELPHNERTVLFMQARPGGGRRNPYAVVSGYKAGEYETSGNSTSVEVETVPPEEQSAIREKLVSIVEGSISFW